MYQALDRAIVQVTMTHAEAAARRQALGIDLELVVLRGHRHPAGPQVEHRMITPVVAESQPRGARPRGLPEQLMTEADAQHRHTLDELPGHRHGRLQLRRITRTVREHDRIGTKGEDGLEVAVVRHHVDLHTPRAQRAQDVALDPVVDEDEPHPRPLAH